MTMNANPHIQALNETNNRKDTFFYFLHIKDNSPKHFTDYWSNIPNHDYTPEELTGMLYGIAKFFCTNTDKATVQTAIEHILENLNSWEGAALNKIDDFNNISLSNTLCAYAKIDVFPSKEFFQAWERAATKQVRHFNSMDLANTLWAYAKLGLQPSADIRENLERKMLCILDEFNSMDLANTLWAYGKLSIDPPDYLLEKMHHKIKTEPDKFNDQDTATALWACAALDAFGIETRPIATTIFSTIDSSFENYGLQNMYVKASLWFDFPFLGQMPPTHHSASSPLSKDLQRAFNCAMANHKYIAPVPALIKKGAPPPFVFDGIVYQSNECNEPLNHRVYISVNNSFDFIKKLNPETGDYEIVSYNGEARLLSALSMKYVEDNAIWVHIPYTCAETILDMGDEEETQPETLLEIAKQATAQSPGNIYYISSETEKTPGDFQIKPLLNETALML
jgi:hypothetical protein